MIRFKPVAIEDREAIERFTLAGEVRNCDMAFANMFCWQPFYRSAWAVVEGFLVVRYYIDGGSEAAYMAPEGSGDLRRIVALLREDAAATGQSLRITGLSERGAEALRTCFGDDFAFDTPRSLADYIYSADDLRTLRGSAYKPKRNHVNRFMAEYGDYRCEPLRREIIGDCMRLEAEWRSRHSTDSRSVSVEAQAMRRAFDNYEALSLTGVAIYVGERMVAFSYGSQIASDMFCTHIEKADIDYDGAFTVVNKALAEHLPEHYRYVNREEDMGLEGLRKAKMSYRPVKLLPKITALDKTPDMRRVAELWTECFGDERGYVDSFLVRCYSPRRMLVRRDAAGRIVSMLHLLRVSCDELGRCAYIFGVATDSLFRRRGYAAALLDEALAAARAEGCRHAVLIPASEHLARYYARRGFAAAETLARFDSELDLGTGDPAADRIMIKSLTGDALPDTGAELHFAVNI